MVAHAVGLAGRDGPLRIEVTCRRYQTAEKEIVFPLTEVVTDNDFFDYKTKYNGEVQEITLLRSESVV